MIAKQAGKIADLESIVSELRLQGDQSGFETVVQPIIAEDIDERAFLADTRAAATTPPGKITVRELNGDKSDFVPTADQDTARGEAFVKAVVKANEVEGAKIIAADPGVRYEIPGSTTRGPRVHSKTSVHIDMNDGRAHPRCR